MRSRILPAGAALVFCAALPGASGRLSGAADPIAIGSRLELFVDDLLVERLEDARIVRHTPQSAGAALRFDRPWEGNTSWTLSVLEDADLYALRFRP